ncbi:uncharacterized protein BT62DRAFT_184967 [Guyanagaster necrorhizus]|uniref:Uncharacterized protein n=1 Tax=Guyanagaster necrorhizus TaxID=856835 RepID=A0A9P8ARJ2_9AGAR|nr:uncharacterized protein BT62DRAFT_184967 [Guyanagaster necrorhizus MCA 3950]KAG7445249.1 hypothetical protein BT62DRAFT_184967 [Guyanagaster necrorhizus MCA 3950]
MATPYDLSVLHPVRSWNALRAPALSPPGLLGATAFISVFYSAAILVGPIRYLFLTWANQLTDPVSNLPLALYYILVIVFTIMVTPLDVIATRLAVQGNSATGLGEVKSISRLFDRLYHTCL